MSIQNEPAPGKLGAATLLDAALAARGRGWSTIPVAGKRAAVPWRQFQEQPADETTLRRMFARSGVTGIAVILGSVSGGLACRDYDRADTYHRWAKANPDDASRLPTVKTARGFHVYGRLDTETYAEFSDGELRADSRHYCLVPPSIHPDGPVYIWTIPLPPPGTALPSLPHSLTEQQTQTIHSDPSDPAHTLHGGHDLPDASKIGVITSTLPTGPGQRNRRLFDLARALKAVAPNATPAELRGIVKQWHRLALPRIRTKDFGESWSDFVIAWERVERPVGQSFAGAAAAADADNPPAIVDQLGYDGHLRRLVGLCWQLQRQWGDKPFPLGCAIAGQYLGASPRHAGRLLKALQFDGVLNLVAKGSKKSGRASEWRFINLETEE